MSDLVTIYIPTKNRLPLLRRAVQSVLGQTARNLEIIVVSDGATDGTCEYVESLAGGPIAVKLIHNEQSRGACVARNQALEIASGRFVTGLDDDDFFMPHRIERFLAKWAELEAQGVQFSCLFDAYIVDEGPRLYVHNTDPVVDAATITAANRIGNQVFTLRTTLLGAGGFDPAMPAWQDWETWVRLVKFGGPAYNINAKTYFMDMTHDFARISLQSPAKILSAAKLFHGKHGQEGQYGDILQAMSYYPQVSLTTADMMHLLKEKKLRVVLRKLRQRKTTLSGDSSVGSQAA
jgi:glycosyltransferase involved in cell wall biosynthesis